MSDKNRDAKIRKLKKLRDKAESAQAIGSEAEAQSFAEMVQKLLTEYKVDESEIRGGLETEADPIVRVRPDYFKHKIKIRMRHIPWLEELGTVVAWGHYCKLLVIPRTSAVVFVGRKLDAETASEVYCKLVNAAEAIADKEYVKYFYECKDIGRVARARGFRASFLAGFITRLAKKYAEYMEELRIYYASNQKALVVLKDAREAVEDFCKGIPEAEAKKPQKIENREGWLRGHDKAAEMNISGNEEL